MKRLAYISIISLLAAAGCQKETLSETSCDEILFEAGVLQTKATDSAFESGDRMSVWAVEYNGDVQMPLQISGNFLNNESLQFNGTKWNGERTLYWSASPCDFYAVYPYQTISSVEEQPFSLCVDQNSEESQATLGGYEESDLMFASATKVSHGQTVNLKFKHMMSHCVVNLVKGEKFEGDIPKDAVVHIYNTVTDAKVNIAKGTLEKDPFGKRKTITMKKVSDTSFEAVIIPQHIETRTPLIEVTMGGIAYLLEYSISFKPSYTHIINLTLNTSPDQEMIEINIDPSTNNWN